MHTGIGLTAGPNAFSIRKLKVSNVPTAACLFDHGGSTLSPHGVRNLHTQTGCAADDCLDSQGSIFHRESLTFFISIKVLGFAAVLQTAEPSRTSCHSSVTFKLPCLHCARWRHVPLHPNDPTPACTATFPPTSLQLVWLSVDKKMTFVQI